MVKVADSDETFKVDQEAVAEDSETNAEEEETIDEEDVDEQLADELNDPTQGEGAEQYQVNLDEIEDEKLDRWIEELLFGEPIQDSREIAGGRVELQLSINTGEENMKVSMKVREEMQDKEQATNQYVSTFIAIVQAAHAIEKVNGDRIGDDSLDAKIKWLRDKPAIFTDQILEEYEKFEAEVATLLSEEADIKNG